MGLSSLPTPSEGMFCILIVNTALSISLVKGIVRSILNVVGIQLSSSSSSSSSSALPDSPEISTESYDFHISSPDTYIDEFRSQNPTILFDTVCKRCELECSVCLAEFKPKSEINRLSCGHMFHNVCLEKWLNYWNVTCPLCRTPLMPEVDATFCF
ncbi:hypothetical protein ACFE04_031312 [Oxalis oulophora]